MSAALSVRARLIGACLRGHREAARLDLHDAASVLGCDPSKVSRVESGERGITDTEVSRLLAAYGAAPDARQALGALTTVTAAGWWKDYRRILDPGYTDILAAEQASTSIGIYAPLSVPELVQAQEYALACAEADPRVPAEIRDVAVAAAMARQDAVVREHATVVTVILGEAALGPPADALQRVQAGHLLDLASGYQNLTVQVLPPGAAAHVPGGTGGFSVLRFSQFPAPGLVLMDGPAGHVCLDSPDVVTAYQRALAGLQSLALIPEKSEEWLQAVAGG
jgi:transcriptional regulator with XRE-family HTH domain